MPPGMMMHWPFPGRTPDGWLLCNGQEISRTSRLGRLLVKNGCVWGKGDGYKTVAIPDLRGRFLMMANMNMENTPYLVGERGGVDTLELSEKHMPVHTHTVAGATHSHGLANGDFHSVPLGTAPQQTAPAGSGEPISLLPPYGVVSMVIKL